MAFSGYGVNLPKFTAKGISDGAGTRNEDYLTSTPLLVPL